MYFYEIKLTSLTSCIYYCDRIAQCSLYAKSLTRPSLFAVMPIRVKRVYELVRLEEHAFCK